MAKSKKSKNPEKSGTRDEVRVIDAGRAESPKDVPDPEVSNEFAEAQHLGTGVRQLQQRLNSEHERPAEVSGGDIDAAWERADEGEETVGGSAPTPDQDVVEQIGEALGVTYEDNEPLKGSEKIEKRDRKRWDLDPASSEDYQERRQR
jgi:hypothetical protein